MSDAKQALSDTDNPGSPNVVHGGDQPSNHLFQVLKIEKIGEHAWVSGTGADLLPQDVLYTKR